MGSSREILSQNRRRPARPSVRSHNKNCCTEGGWEMGPSLPPTSPDPELWEHQIVGIAPLSPTSWLWGGKPQSSQPEKLQFSNRSAALPCKLQPQSSPSPHCSFTPDPFLLPLPPSFPFSSIKLIASYLAPAPITALTGHLLPSTCLLYLFYTFLQWVCLVPSSTPSALGKDLSLPLCLRTVGPQAWLASSTHIHGKWDRH